jgi:hypothetical protein
MRVPAPAVPLCVPTVDGRLDSCRTRWRPSQPAVDAAGPVALRHRLADGFALFSDFVDCLHAMADHMIQDGGPMISGPHRV